MHLVVGKWSHGSLPLLVTLSSCGITLCHALAVSLLMEDILHRGQRSSIHILEGASSICLFSSVRWECLFCRDMTSGLGGRTKTGGLWPEADWMLNWAKLCLSPQCLHLCIPGALLRPSSNWHWWGFSSLFYQVSQLSCSIYERCALLYYSSPVRVFLSLVFFFFFF